MIEKVLLGNDIDATWTIQNANFGDTVKLYMIDAKGKRQIDVVKTSVTNFTFKLLASIQTLGKVRFEVYWTSTNSNRRVVANNVIEFVDNPENVTLQSDDIITNITLNTIGNKTTINAD